MPKSTCMFSNRWYARSFTCIPTVSSRLRAIEKDEVETSTVHTTSIWPCRPPFGSRPHPPPVSLAGQPPDHSILTINRYRSRICEESYTMYYKHCTSAPDPPQLQAKQDERMRTSLYCKYTFGSVMSLPGPFGMWQPLSSGWSSASPASCHSAGCVRPRPFVDLQVQAKQKAGSDWSETRDVCRARRGCEVQDTYFAPAFLQSSSAL